MEPETVQAEAMPTEEVPFEISQAPKVETALAPEVEKVPEVPLTKKDETPVEEAPAPVEEKVPIDKVPKIEVPKPEEGKEYLLYFGYQEWLL